MGRNIEWTERYLATLPKDLAESPLAAAMLTLAEGLDNPHNSFTSQTMGTNSLDNLMTRLRELAPDDKKADDQLDELSSRRGRRRRDATA